MNIIVIPYRNRKSHLDFFIKNTIPLFEKYLTPFKIVVVDQTESKLFNRGKLLNIGVAENFSRDNTYYLHDVDTVPTEFCVSKNYTMKLENNTVIGLYNCKKYETMGGAIKINGKDFSDINGFPNNIFGWGAEDKALKNRADFYKKVFIRTVLVGQNDVDKYYILLKDLHDSSRASQQSKEIHFQEYHLFSKLTDNEKEKHIKNSGLNNLEYKILSKTSSQYVDHIIVDI